MAVKTSWQRYGTKLRHCHPVHMRLQAKFCGDRSKPLPTSMGIYRFVKMAAIRHLGFVARMQRVGLLVLFLLCDVCKTGCSDAFNCFDNMQYL